MNRLKKIDLNSGGITKVPSCPRSTAAISVQAVAPTENPLIWSRPKNVPNAIESSRKISGAVETIHLIVSIGAILNRGLLQGRIALGRSPRFKSSGLANKKGREFWEQVAN